MKSVITLYILFLLTISNYVKADNDVFIDGFSLKEGSYYCEINYRYAAEQNHNTNKFEFKEYRTQGANIRLTIEEGFGDQVYPGNHTISFKISGINDGHTYSHSFGLLYFREANNVRAIALNRLGNLIMMIHANGNLKFIINEINFKYSVTDNKPFEEVIRATCEDF